MFIQPIRPVGLAGTDRKSYACCSIRPVIPDSRCSPGRCETDVRAACRLAWAGYPEADTLKQILDRRLQQLKPQEVTEQNVLFRDVRPGPASAGSHLFQVSATIRDYTPGYPRNRYYGQTCVAQIDGTYKLWAAPSGQWQVDGRMTPDLSSRQCKPNPSDGVSSIPVQNLPGTPAAGGAAPAALRPSPAQPEGWWRALTSAGLTGRPERCLTSL